MASHILRLKRTDKPNEHLLLHVSSQQRGLNLKLVGTEHEHLYHAKLRGDSDLKATQSNQFTGNLEEFKDVLRYALLHDRPDGPLPDSLQGLETVAAISGKALTVTVRKNIGGITQRLASIKLEQDDEREEVSAFEWVDEAVATTDTLRSTLEGLQTEITGQRDQIARLSQQLDDLVKAKKEHEDELLKKFAALLNAKKLKIRDQQRLLKGAKIDPEAAEEMDDIRQSRRKDQTLRSSKRKSEHEHAESDDEDAFENEEQHPQDTPPASDEEDADDDDLDGPMAPQPVSTSQGRSGTYRATNGDGGEQMDVEEEAPPRRELPFQRKSAQPAHSADDEDEDETDEEL